MTNEEKMTPEEAIAEISFLKVAVNKVMEQALEMAIQALSSWEEYSDKLWKEAYERGKTEALSQEPNGYVNIAKDLIDDEKDSIFYQEPCEDTISRLDKIRQIIAIPNSVIQEDVMKYKMICEVMNDDKSVS